MDTMDDSCVGAHISHSYLFLLPLLHYSTPVWGGCIQSLCVLLQAQAMEESLKTTQTEPKVRDGMEATLSHCVDVVIYFKTCATVGSQEPAASKPSHCAPSTGRKSRRRKRKKKRKRFSVTSPANKCGK